MNRVGFFTAAIATTGAVAAGVVLLEAALVPGLVIGAAVLAPRLLAARPRPAAQSPRKPRWSLGELLPKSLDDLVHVRLSQAVVKTVTFRVIVTSLDFAGNYLILREPVTAAGLSAISLVGGPLLYFLHEGAWNYAVGTGKLEHRAALANRPLAKTITYRTIATIVEFTTNYVVVRDLGTAALLSAVGFFIGPFVYYGHELAWERAGARADAPARRWTPRPVVVTDVEPVIA